MKTSAQAALDAGDIPLYYLIAADYLQTGDVTSGAAAPEHQRDSRRAASERLILNTLSQRRRSAGLPAPDQPVQYADRPT